MKSLSSAFTIFLVFFFISSSMAQTEKGSKLLGGSASVQFNDPFTLILNPTAGIFVLDRLALGSTLTLDYSSAMRADSPHNRQSFTAGVAPFIRYYLGKSKLQYFLLADVGVYRNWRNFYQAGYDSRVANNYLNPSGGIGAVYFIAKHIGLEAILNYRIYRNTLRTDNENLTLNFGFQVYLPSAKDR
jgi:hypothetical protein